MSSVDNVGSQHQLTSSNDGCCLVFKAMHTVAMQKCTATHRFTSVYLLATLACMHYEPIVYLQL